MLISLSFCIRGIWVQFGHISTRYIEDEIKNAKTLKVRGCYLTQTSRDYWGEFRRLFCTLFDGLPETKKKNGAFYFDCNIKNEDGVYQKLTDWCKKEQATPEQLTPIFNNSIGAFFAGLK